ncbi:RNA polymerase sigma factor [Haliangium ochraceum]|nr:sigma-70 family RNA polymerase sigma factor [Haliangium ochraceum]
MSGDGFDDEETLRRWQAGDIVASAALFERYYAAVERFFVNKVSVGVGDLVQETFKGCLESRERLRDLSKFRSYLFSIAYNVFRNHLRSKRMNGREVDIEDVTMATLSPGPRSVVIARERSDERLLLEGLRKIPANYQVILELHYWEDLSTGEMAEVLGVTPGAANGLLQRARKKLEAILCEIADSPETLRTTMDNLERWAERWHQAVERDDPGSEPDDG